VIKNILDAVRSETYMRLRELLLSLLTPMRLQQTEILEQLRTLNQKVTLMSGTLDTDIAQLVADNAQLQAEVAGAPAAIATLVATAIAGATNLGATAAQLQSLADLHTALGGANSQLQTALTGVPPAPPVATTATAQPTPTNTGAPNTPPAA
jgi:hypothetical protein